MEADRWQRINSAFFSAFRLDPERRASLLQRLCADAPELIDEVSSLVTAHQAAGDFIESPVISASHLLDTIAARMIEGRRVGPYRIVRKIDHGGMGVVYLAERADDAFQKLVAVKIIRSGLDSLRNLRGFRKERQILARLEHPNIARLLDGGDTEDGLPYLVMEYIAGQPIDVYCDAHQLTVPERLHLFRKVCSAVEYAHENDVVHRDIKPGNILVTEGAEPKLLDFGIAKLVSRPFGASTTIDVPRMTPEYTSPEEARGQQVNHATDIYSLGIVLYELLTGQRPYDIRARSPQEIFRSICEEMPEKPSARVCRNASAQRNSELRGTKPKPLRRALAGAVDNIVLKAIRKEPSRRYLSVRHFAEDIDRYLNAEPVSAQRGTTVYRTGLFLRKCVGGVVAASLLVAAIAGGIGGVSRYRRLAQLRGLEVERHTKEGRRQILEATERARAAEAELSHLRQTEQAEEKTRKAESLKRLIQVLDARPMSRGLMVNTDEVVFDAGRIILSPAARERLSRIAGALVELTNMRVQVEGHADSYGDEAYNQALSDERARVVQAYLVAQGLPRERITYAGLGAMNPIASNGTDSGRQNNRRVNVILSGTLSEYRLGTTLRNRPRLIATNLNSPSDDVRKPPGKTVGKNLAFNKTATGSTPCNSREGPEKAFNGSVSEGNLDKWCSEALPSFLLVDLGSIVEVGAFVVKHTSAGGEALDFNTRDFDIQLSTDGVDFSPAVAVVGNTEGITRHSITPSHARFVRMGITVPGQSAAIKASRIYELEVYPPGALALQGEPQRF